MIAALASTGNALLDALPAADRADLHTDLRIISVAAHETTESVGGRIACIDFPIDAVLSVVALLEGGESVEVGSVGRESFVENDVALDSGVAQRAAFCQVRGTVARMPVERFRTRMAESPAFARLIRQNIRATLFATQQFAACNATHSLVQRTARWLSMTEDRVGANHYTLAREFLAIMLGVKPGRAADGMGPLEQIGAIAYKSGRVTILARGLLNAGACRCYATCKRAYRDSLGE